MESKNTLYMTVYKDLRRQIMVGQLAYGSSLPSSRQLCAVYHVGIRTIKTVLRLLKKEGLIRTEERKRPMVIYKSVYKEEGQTAIQTLLNRKDAILSVYQTAEILMPDIIAFSTRYGCLLDWDKYDLVLKIGKKKKRFGSWRVTSALIHEILRASGNMLFSPMYASLELYEELPFFMEYQQALTAYTLHGDDRDIDWIKKILQNYQPYLVRSGFDDLYHKVTLYVKKSFDKLAEQLPAPTMIKRDYFKWKVSYGRNYLYIQIARDLYIKIGMRDYQPGEFLPAEAKLARHYKVSLSTMRKAIARLNLLGFCETINGKGTRVLEQSSKAVSLKKMAPEDLQEALLYLSGAQLMALIIRPAALYTFDFLDDAVQQQLEQQLSEPNCIPLENLLAFIIEKTPLYPLKVILQETNKVLNCGYGYIFFSNAHKNRIHLYMLGRHAYFCLKRGDRQGFADNLQKCYSDIVRRARHFLLQIGFMDASQIEPPV